MLRKRRERVKQAFRKIFHTSKDIDLSKRVLNICTKSGGEITISLSDLTDATLPGKGYIVLYCGSCLYAIKNSEITSFTIHVLE